MNASLRAFMTSLVDYAGLFPPADLDMGEAVAEYARWLADPAAWMLGRFIVPAGRLPELDTALAQSAVTGTWRYSVLAGSREGAGACLDALPEQAALVLDFEARQAGSAGIEVLEIPLPSEVCRSTGELDSFLADLRGNLVKSDFGVQGAYLEIPPAADPDLVAGAMAGQPGENGGPFLALKLRCGGITPELFPPLERLAAVLAACARAEIPLKFTAGLHHPVRHQAEVPPVMMHGFFNVFGAGLLAHAGAAAADIAGCLAETEAEAFAFAEDDFTWRGCRVATADLVAFRRQFLHGFGSCSFAEPVADLQDLGLL